MSSKQHNDRPNHLLTEALRHHQCGNLAEAESHYRQMLQADRNHTDALHLLGVIAYQKGEYAAAVELIEQALALNPAAPSYHNNLGNAFLGMNDTEKAIQCFQEALRLKPDYVEPCNNLGNAFRKSGRMNEALDQYVKAVELKQDYVPAINNLANALKEAGRLDEALGYYHKAVLLNTGMAEAYLNYGNALTESDRHDEALAQYRKALSINPDYAEVHNEIGNVLKRKGRYEESAAHYKRALRLNPALAETYNNLADAFRELGKFDEAVEFSRKAIEMRSGFAPAYVTMGNILLSQGDVSGALAHYQKAIDLDREMSDAHYNRGLVLLLRGDLQEGWKEYEWRFKSREISRNIGYRDRGIPLWDGSGFEGRTILIMSEQGAGDNIQFARYIPQVKARGGTVIFECPKELTKMFEGFSGIDVLVEKPFTPVQGDTPDICIPLLSLPRLFNTTIDTITADVPYFNISPEAVRKWESLFDTDLFKVGLAWSGNPAHRNDRNRSCRLNDLAPLFSSEEIQFYSLQKQGIGESEYDLLAGRGIADLGKEVHDYYDTAAIIEHLDLVITVDTSVAHLAGALGKEVWTLLPFVPDWRWMLDRQDTPWYPSMRLFRQPAHGDWKSVIETIASELKKLGDRDSQ